MKKMRSSTKIALGAAIILVGGWFTYKTVTDQMILNEKFAPLRPGKVNIVGVDSDLGYRIVVANQVAQLVQADTKFEASSSSDGGATSGAVKQRVPLRDMLNTLQGDEKAASQFVMLMNQIREDDSWPTVRIIWTSKDVDRALNGDAALKARLERDINMKLSGDPLDRVNVGALQNGIIVESPVKLRVMIDGKERVLTATIQRPYKPRMVREVEKAYENKNVTENDIALFYADAARAVLNGESPKDDIAGALRDMIDEEKTRTLAELPERVLGAVTILATEDLIDSASYRTYSGSDGKLHDLNINLRDEARRRMWQYSKTRVGSQLLLVAEGIAIAAPRIQQELLQSNLTITQMRDEVLLREAVELLNRKDKRTAQR